MKNEKIIKILIYIFVIITIVTLCYTLVNYAILPVLKGKKEEEKSKLLQEEAYANYKNTIQIKTKTDADGFISGSNIRVKAENFKMVDKKISFDLKYELSEDFIKAHSDYADYELSESFLINSNSEVIANCSFADNSKDNYVLISKKEFANLKNPNTKIESNDSVTKVVEKLAKKTITIENLSSDYVSANKLDLRIKSIKLWKRNDYPNSVIDVSLDEEFRFELNK